MHLNMVGTMRKIECFDRHYKLMNILHNFTNHFSVFQYAMYFYLGSLHPEAIEIF